MLEAQIAGYDFGQVPRSSVTLKELHELGATLEFSERDRQALRRAGALISDHAENLVDGWREIIGTHDFLAHWFSRPNGKADKHYKAAVKKRFVRLGNRPGDTAVGSVMVQLSAIRHTRKM